MRDATRPNPRYICIPCQQHEHQHCRHQGDGPRFGRGEGTCKCEDSGHHLLDGRCAATVRGDGWGFHPCWKPAKRDVEVHTSFGGIGRGGEMISVPMCGVHAAARDRVIKNDQARQAKYAAREAERARAKELCAAVDETIRFASAAFDKAGLAVPLEHDHKQWDDCGGKVLIPHEHLRALADLVAELSGTDLPGWAH